MGSFLVTYEIVINKCRYLLCHNVDLYYALFIISFLFLSNISNVYDKLDHQVFFGHSVLLYGYVLYKIMDILYCHITKAFGSYKKSRKYIYDKLILVLIITALISITRYMNLTYITGFVNSAWPMYYSGEIVNLSERGGRMVSTFSSIPGTGIVYGIFTAVNIHLYNSIGGNKYIIYAILLGMSTLLTGSITSFIILFALVGIEIKNNFSVKLILYFAVILLTILAFAWQNDFIRNELIENRIESQMQTINSGESVLPSTLNSRVGHWLIYIKLITDYPLFGTGAINIQQLIGYTTNPHNYYLYVLAYSGIIGLIAFIILINQLYKIIFLYNLTIEKYIITGLLISFITSLSFQYGGTLEIFSITLGVIANYKRI